MGTKLLTVTCTPQDGMEDSPASPETPDDFERHWWNHPLAEDIHNTLKEKENVLRPFFAQSPQIKSRRYLVDWLAMICDHYDICPTGRHLAVTLMDFFMDSFDIADQQLKLVASGSLLVAVKFEEQESKIPRAKDLNKYTSPCSYTCSEFQQMELVLLDFFGWHIGFPTASHFTNYFLTGAVVNSDLHGQQPVMDTDLVKSYIAKYTNYFLEISLQDHFYREYKPSLVGAACIASSRACLNITPVWNLVLQNLTNYMWADIQPVVEVMHKTLRMDEELDRRRKEVAKCPTPNHSEPATPVRSVISKMRCQDPQELISPRLNSSGEPHYQTSPSSSGTENLSVSSNIESLTFEAVPCMALETSASDYVPCTSYFKPMQGEDEDSGGATIQYCIASTAATASQPSDVSVSVTCAGNKQDLMIEDTGSGKVQFVLTPASSCESSCGISDPVSFYASAHDLSSFDVNSVPVGYQVAAPCSVDGPGLHYQIHSSTCQDSRSASIGSATMQYQIVPVSGPTYQGVKLERNSIPVTVIPPPFYSCSSNSCLTVPDRKS